MILDSSLIMIKEFKSNYHPNSKLGYGFGIMPFLLPLIFANLGHQARQISFYYKKIFTDKPSLVNQ